MRETQARGFRGCWRFDHKLCSPAGPPNSKSVGFFNGFLDVEKDEESEVNIMQHVLTLDAGGRPSRWSSWEDAIGYIVKGLVPWYLGDEVVYQGGTSRLTGMPSEISVPNIIAVSNEVFDDRVTLTNSSLFFRDDYTCCYCNKKFGRMQLTREHIVPVSKGGPNTWMNCATACRRCNGAKSNKSLKDSGFELHYAPYVPSKSETLIIARRNIQADQLQFLCDSVPKNSPFHKRARQPLNGNLETWLG